MCRQTVETLQATDSRQISFEVANFDRSSSVIERGVVPYYMIFSSIEQFSSGPQSCNACCKGDSVANRGCGIPSSHQHSLCEETGEAQPGSQSSEADLLRHIARALNFQDGLRGLPSFSGSGSTSAMSSRRTTVA